ncbi:MAG: dodecin domain-containing protein [Acidimicrobiales bacterium]|nr:dodecin domain-containing protein [Acidimicrobiales bacterium]
MTVAKTIEISAESTTGFDDAVKTGIAKAGETVHNIDGAWIKEMKVLVAEGAVTAYRVHMQVTFTLD